MSRAVLSVGSNVGDRRAHLRSVVAGFAGEVIAVSPVYSTAPWGGVEQDDFYNITLIAEGSRSVRSWLTAGAELERAAQREREIRWGPRTLDVDVISVEDSDGIVVRNDDPTLILPHPRADQRAFVLVPWLDVDPDAVLHTSSGIERVDALVAQIDSAELAGVRRLGELDGDW
ncbi:2-amino-4-hydroxy-6-hydroxymethyldihydropteridine pyrophosphokinase [Gordonia effusa NBRC 100432]|uniref:2-amino-4-hydroxy-6-hydroxymethyldihydropteridine diphosphokinase n=1 Tax=Gordonia effusa NBRC 100432 TaxID=1077974 RepID=H0R2A5_9ACTN|nr:2-amino-4-hydroxy-6-hydroxymethyldihydropteridine diphosphokinase [Gordonia effusa]GAB19206.1 2-amino-4-hydroxy-6-hydroxymethyldihydropteridine pyrophosphokinase [Gordonia effusa NBRC 100432]